MSALEVVNAYVAVRRAQGVQLRSSAKVLRQFARETGYRPLSEVTPEAVAAFLHGRGELSATWKTKRGVLVGFYRFAIARGYATVSPLPEWPPKLPPQQTPYVYSPGELQRLLDATATLSTPLSRLQAATYRMLLLILYGAGLRVSEAIRLNLRDADLAQRIITVRDTKFYKTRLVPIGPRLTSALLAYIEKRSALALPLGQDSALLCSRTGHRLAYQYVITLFQHVRSTAGISCPAGEPRPPRLHDLRHNSESRIIPHTDLRGLKSPENTRPRPPPMRNNQRLFKKASRRSPGRKRGVRTSVVAALANACSLSCISAWK